jgi:hypothetical protein
MEFIVEIYNKIWEFILKVLAEAGVNFDVTKVPEWLNVPSLPVDGE